MIAAGTRTTLGRSWALVSQYSMIYWRGVWIATCQGVLCSALASGVEGWLELPSVGAIVLSAYQALDASVAKAAQSGSESVFCPARLETHRYLHRCWLATAQPSTDCSSTRIYYAVIRLGLTHLWAKCPRTEDQIVLPVETCRGSLDRCGR
ncbi:hypothetical protein J3A83DRAFT_2398675 [Scleroderma citrinum]